MIEARVCEPKIVDGELDATTQRADSTAFLMEEPIILNPERRYPEYHIFFLKHGQVKGITEEGRTTVDVCKLDRDSATVRRRQKIDDYVNSIAEIIDEYTAKEINEDELKGKLKVYFRELFYACLPDRPYSRLSWFMYAHFDTFILPRFGPKTQRLLKKRFEIFQEDRPWPPSIMFRRSVDPQNTP